MTDPVETHGRFMSGPPQPPGPLPRDAYDRVAAFVAPSRKTGTVAVAAIGGLKPDGKFALAHGMTGGSEQIVLAIGTMIRDTVAVYPPGDGRLAGQAALVYAILMEASRREDVADALMLGIGRAFHDILPGLMLRAEVHATEYPLDKLPDPPTRPPGP